MAQGAHQKRESLTTENEEEAKKGKGSTQRNVVVIHQSHLLLLQKVIHLKKNRKRLVKRGENIAAKIVHLLQMNQILKQIISEADKYTYNLPTNVANYANEQFHSYVKDTEIKQQILLTNPVPENLNKAKKFGEFGKDILKEKHKQKDAH